MDIFDGNFEIFTDLYKRSDYYYNLKELVTGKMRSKKIDDPTLDLEIKKLRKLEKYYYMRNFDNMEVDEILYLYLNDIAMILDELDRPLYFVWERDDDDWWYTKEEQEKDILEYIAKRKNKERAKKLKKINGKDYNATPCHHKR